MNHRDALLAYPQPMTSSPDSLLLRETCHRSANDLQLIVSLLSLQSHQAKSAETRAALTDAAGRVAVLAGARAALQQRQPSLETALRRVCEALITHAEPRAIHVSLDVAPVASRFTGPHVTTLALIVNELATNAIKHAFNEDRGGCIRISVVEHDRAHLAIIVDDDGLPFPGPDLRRPDGLGLGLARRLMESVGGLVILPPVGSKRFEIRVPFNAA